MAYKYFDYAIESVSENFGDKHFVGVCCSYKCLDFKSGAIFPDGSSIELGINEHEQLFTYDFKCKHELTEFRVYGNREIDVRFICGVSSEQIRAVLFLVKLNNIKVLNVEMVCEDCPMAYFTLKDEYITFEEIVKNILKLKNDFGRIRR